MPAEIVQIQDPTGRSTARILVSQGFNCFSWRPMLSDGPREILWAMPDVESGDTRPSSSGIPLLFPFPGRIGGARVRFEGREFQLESGDAFGNAIHGFVLNRPWRLVHRTNSKVSGEFQASIDDPTILEHWPADFRIQISYEVHDNELRTEIEYENTGAGRLPCGFATHAYFRLPLVEGGNVADTIVTVPASEYWESNQMIPTGNVLEVPSDTRLDAGRRLGNLQFDTVFTNLKAGNDGRFRTTLVDPSSKRILTQTFDRSFTQCVVYTPGHREAICMEPYTCVPDAIRLAAEGRTTGLQLLAPGESRRTSIRLSVE